MVMIMPTSTGGDEVRDGDHLHGLNLTRNYVGASASKHQLVQLIIKMVLGTGS